MEKVEDPKIVLNRLKSEVQLKDANGGFKNIRHLNSGAIVIESYNKTQQSKLKEILKDKEGIKIKENETNDPMFVIIGISKGYEDEEFVKELVRLNNDIELELNQSVADKIKVITKRQCRNPTKQNWVLQSYPEIAM
nr:unnamed protein product [Callosobruchus analis]